MRAEAEEQQAEARRIEEEARIAARVGATVEAEALTAKAAMMEAQAFHVERKAESVKPGKPEGTRETWKWRIADESLIPRSWLVPDKDRLDWEAKRKKGEARVDGIEFYPEYTLHGRG